MGHIVPLQATLQNSTRPTLDLSGPKLRAAFEALVRASEAIGGIERFAEGLKLKSQVFQERLGDGQIHQFDQARFAEIVPLMATVRRRAGTFLAEQGWLQIRSAIVALLDDAARPATASQRVAAFCDAFPKTKAHRFIRDLASEILHNVLPEHYPLMTRWVWDTKTNSGALREIWHGDNVDQMVIDVPDDYEMFLVLREELSQFLSENGLFRDMIWYVDLLLGQVYGDYINAQGGAWLKTDFGSDSDPLEHTRRILGVDARIAKHPGFEIDGTVIGSEPTKRLN